VARNGLIPYVANGDLYVADIGTGRTRLLVGGPEKDSARGYSPDGTRMAFIRDTGPAYVDGTPAPIDL
jgi:Tol biopolymer transport system component